MPNSADDTARRLVQLFVLLNKERDEALGFETLIALGRSVGLPRTADVRAATDAAAGLGWVWVRTDGVLPRVVVTEAGLAQRLVS